MTSEEAQALFPNYKLSQEEINWVDHFKGISLLEPLYGEEVTDEESFLAMIWKNHNHIEDWMGDILSTSNKFRQKLPYHLKYV